MEMFCSSFRRGGVKVQYLPSNANARRHDPFSVALIQDDILPTWPGPEEGLGGQKAVFPLKTAYSEQWSEMCYIHFLRMIAMGTKCWHRHYVRCHMHDCHFLPFPST